MSAPSDSPEALSALLLGSKTSAYARRQARNAVSSLSAPERSAIAAKPDAIRRHAWLLTSQHMERLRQNAYAIRVFEDDDIACGRDSLELRDWFSATFSSKTPRVPEGSATPRAAFVAWRVFQARVHAKKVYLPFSTVRASAGPANLDARDLDPALVPAFGNPDLATHVEYAKCQASIRSMLRNATVVCPRASSAMDISGLDDAQRRISRGIAETPFSVLTGGAGTGKSTLIGAVVRAFLAMGITVVCLAPTHRAKKNLSKRLPTTASVVTIDAFVRTGSSAAGAANSSGRRSSGPKFVFVDESSMLDLEKGARLARKVAEGGSWQICLAGDDGQLEPIERGELFRTAIHNGGPHVFKLEKCYRAESVDLFAAQTDIRDGLMPKASPSMSIELRDSDATVERFVKSFVESRGASVQFIAWTNRTCDLVNGLVQRRERGPVLNPGTPVVGDRVVFCGRNDPKRNLTNAMCGVVKGFRGPSTLVVEWEDGAGEIECPTRDAPLAYCITVHKAQGSEYDSVCVVATAVSMMARSLDRRWLYTAVSRAKKSCAIITTPALEKFVANPMQKRELLGINFANLAGAKSTRGSAPDAGPAGHAPGPCGSAVVPSIASVSGQHSAA